MSTISSSTRRLPSSSHRRPYSAAKRLCVSTTNHRPHQNHAPLHTRVPCSPCPGARSALALQWSAVQWFRSHAPGSRFPLPVAASQTPTVLPPLTDACARVRARAVQKRAHSWPGQGRCACVCQYLLSCVGQEVFSGGIRLAGALQIARSFVQSRLGGSVPCLLRLHDSSFGGE